MSRPELTGQRFGSWRALRPGRAAQDRHAQWLCICDCGNTALVRTGYLTGGYSTRCRSCAIRVAQAARTLPDAEVTYNAVHFRLRDQRGRASVHTCACGERAEQWAYQHGDPQERMSLMPRSRRPARLLGFTPNLDAYAPMCAPCHIRLDLQHAQVNDSTKLVNGVSK